jgi:hypothetical protein
MSKTPLVAADTCFTENGQLLPLPRRALMEGAGSFLLMLIVVGTGMISQTRADDPLLRMLVIAIATSAALVGLIVSLGPVTGGHLNPLISGMQWFPGRERSFSCALLYILAQVAGAFAGAACANRWTGVVSTPYHRKAHRERGALQRGPYGHRIHGREKGTEGHRAVGRGRLDGCRDRRNTVRIVCESRDNSSCDDCRGTNAPLN